MCFFSHQIAPLLLQTILIFSSNAKPHEWCRKICKFCSFYFLSIDMLAFFFLIWLSFKIKQGFPKCISSFGLVANKLYCREQGNDIIRQLKIKMNLNDRLSGNLHNTNSFIHILDACFNWLLYDLSYSNRSNETASSFFNRQFHNLFYFIP